MLHWQNKQCFWPRGLLFSISVHQRKPRLMASHWAESVTSDNTTRTACMCLYQPLDSCIQYITVGLNPHYIHQVTVQQSKSIYFIYTCFSSFQLGSCCSIGLLAFHLTGCFITRLQAVQAIWYPHCHTMHFCFSCFTFSHVVKTCKKGIGHRMLRLHLTWFKQLVSW